MKAIGLTRACVVQPIAACLRRMGSSIERHLTRSGLPQSILTDPEVLIPSVSVVRLLSETALLEGIPDLGLRVGHEASVGMLGTFGRLVSRGLTLGDALDALVRYHPGLSSNERLWLAPRGDRVELGHAFDNKLDRHWQQASHYALMFLVGTIQIAAGKTWRPACVTLQTEESPALANFEPLSRTEVTFGQPSTSVFLPRTMLDLTMRPASHRDQADDVEAWNASAPGRDCLAAVVHVVEMLASESYPSIKQTAETLGMSVRTLQRQLTEAGCTHEDVVARIRFETATAMLKKSDAKILDIALDVGYSDHAHFTRAFRRWAGCSPQEYRRRELQRLAGLGAGRTSERGTARSMR